MKVVRGRSAVLLALLATLPAVSTLADSDPATDDVVNLFPYTGILEKDGAGVSGVVVMRFSLYDALGTAPLWFETQSVDVYRGRFTALLGLCDRTPAACPGGDADPVAIDDVIQFADDLQLGIVLNPGPSEVVLQNRKRFLPVPYAVWTRAASSLQVARDLAVGGNSSFTGDVTAAGRLVVRGVELSCPNDTPTRHGQCWWLHYATAGLTHSQAAQACAAQHARLCTVAEMSSLQSAGAEECTYGWFADRVDSGTMYIGFPIQTATANSASGGCGYGGLNLQTRPANSLHSAYCCR
ncbi:MAG: hypothetical protein HY904_00450 [Deltaproteobacteria bacterium]|nr:hypothetical protein [Deltaproteobacteria bacterium]